MPTEERSDELGRQFFSGARLDWLRFLSLERNFFGYFLGYKKVTAMNRAYNPQEIEQKIYQFWEEGGFFEPQGEGDPYCIIMPPPNANEALHAGHAVFVAIEDALIRFHRMRGAKTLWLPGADHAGFETQVVFEKKLEKKGQSRFDFDRETLYKMIWDYVQENKDVAKNQLKRLGASCDWSRAKFTLDPDIIKTVYETFKQMHEDGLIYRGERVINWCPKHQTGFSELEVKYEDREDKLWFIKYPLKDKSGFITVATTRPETMLGDTAIAVNPKDERYRDLIGAVVKLPLTSREIPVVADEAVEMDFGTGAVKVTPAHDQADFEISQRHSLPIIAVIGKTAKMTEEAGKEYAGLKTEEARAKIVEDLKAQGLLEKEEPYKHSVGTCYKCGRVIEPMVSKQWFIKVASLAEKAIAAIKKGDARFTSKKYERIFMHWMQNIRDWNISRQIVWGIRIPVWYCGQDKTCYVISDQKPDRCPRCGATEFIPEEDTFDTWFSSGQWPFAALQTAKKGDFETFYPTSVMETGWDILFFWVARMLMLGIYRIGLVPFKDIYMHGLVRDKDKQKMSKSKGNVINPLAVVDEHGADALRMSLVFGSSNESDIVLSEDKIIAHRKFANKIWNASRFTLSQLESDFNPAKVKPVYSKEDRWILKELEKTIKEVTQNIEKYKFHEAAQAIYHFFWHSFCDRCIEDAKKRIYKPDSEEDKQTAQLVLWSVFYDSLKLLHPFMPFITEEIYQKLPGRPKEALIIEKWPSKIEI